MMKRISGKAHCLAYLFAARGMSMCARPAATAPECDNRAKGHHLSQPRFSFFLFIIRGLKKLRPAKVNYH
jgi:hypothetical protein